MPENQAVNSMVPYLGTIYVSNPVAKIEVVVFGESPANLIRSQILVNNKDIDVKTQQVIESDQRCKESINRMIIAAAELENARNNTFLRGAELEETRRNNMSNNRMRMSEFQSDRWVRSGDLSLRRARFEFDKAAQGVQDSFRAAEIGFDQYSNLWKLLSNSTGGVLHQSGIENQPWRDFKISY